MNEQTLTPPPVTGSKKRDYWWTVVFTDPIALPFVRLLARKRWMTPDQVSILAAILGALVGPLFALGTTTGLIAGGLMFQLAFIVDCVDGKLARALGTTSAKGETLDRIGDATRRASASLGLAIFLWRSDDYTSDAILVAAVYAVAAYFFIELSGGSEVRQEAWFKKPQESPPAPTEATAAPEPKSWSGTLARWRLLPTPGMPDVQALVFVVGPISGFVTEALWVGTGVVGVGILINLWRHLR